VTALKEGMQGEGSEDGRPPVGCWLLQDKALIVSQDAGVRSGQGHGGVGMEWIAGAEEGQRPGRGGVGEEEGGGMRMVGVERIVEVT